MAELVVRVHGRSHGRPWLKIGIALIRLGAWCVGRFGVEVSIDEGPWQRVFPRKGAD